MGNGHAGSQRFPKFVVLKNEDVILSYVLIINELHSSFTSQSQTTYFRTTHFEITPAKKRLLRVGSGLRGHLQGMVGFTPTRGLSKPHVCSTL